MRLPRARRGAVAASKLEPLPRWIKEVGALLHKMRAEQDYAKGVTVMMKSDGGKMKKRGRPARTTDEDDPHTQMNGAGAWGS